MLLFQLDVDLIILIRQWSYTTPTTITNNNNTAILIFECPINLDYFWSKLKQKTNTDVSFQHNFFLSFAHISPILMIVAGFE